MTNEMFRLQDDLTENIIKSSKREPKLVFQEKARCPRCGNFSLIIKEYIYSVPYFGEILLSQGECKRCGYKYRDVKILNATDPKKIIVNVNGEEELRYLLIKSATSAVLIKEKGYKMLPGPASVGFITTVEGILLRFLEATYVACRGRELEPGCKNNIDWLKRAIDGYEKFTLVICDFDGTSSVKGKKVLEASIDSECEELRGESLQYLYKK